MKHDGLVAALDGAPYRPDCLGGEGAVDLLLASGVGQVDDRDGRRLGVAVSLGKSDETEFPGKRLVISLYRRGGRPQQGLGSVKTREHHGRVARVITRSGVELLE